MPYCVPSVPDTTREEEVISSQSSGRLFLQVSYVLPPSKYGYLYAHRIYENRDVVFPARSCGRCGRRPHPHQPYLLEEKSMKKVCALLIFAGLCAAVFLSSAASDYIHGTIIPVDGGWLAR